MSAFLRSYKAVWKYRLAFAVVADRPPGFKLEIDNLIGMTRMHLREAWQIGRNDLACVGILETDDPVIPLTKAQPPVLELLNWMRSRSSG